MRFRSLTRPLASLALLAVVALAGCDDSDPIDPTPFCDSTANQNSLACAVQAGEVAYDTTGTTITVQDLGNGLAPRVGEVTWSDEYTYLLDGRVFVNDGQTLRIDAGTVVKAEGGVGTAASALIVARGGQIFAEGTADAPIIFTAEADDLADPADLEAQGGLWGGVVLLGTARTNTVPGVRAIEGIPTSETRGLYGCGDAFACDDADDSGVFRYVSIRHGGTDIGAANELNGLTMGGVGSGTTIEYVEVFANQDDGFEWFGGTADARYLVAAFPGDDLFDYDEGWRGRGQFFFGIHGAADGNQLGEHDGGTDPEDGTPYATPTIYNATYIGSGPASGNGDSNGILFRDNAGGSYYNSIFAEAATYAINVEDLSSGQDSRARLEAGELALRNNLFGGFGAGSDPNALFVGSGSAGSGNAWLVGYMTAGAQANVVADPLFVSVSRAPDGGLDPRPSGASPALTMARFAYPNGGDAFFTPVSYVGAFGASDDWLRGWTALDQLGYLAN
jgi:hypothetical protein